MKADGIVFFATKQVTGGEKPVNRGFTLLYEVRQLDLIGKNRSHVWAGMPHMWASHAVKKGKFRFLHEQITPKLIFLSNLRRYSELGNDLKDKILTSLKTLLFIGKAASVS